MEFRLDMFRTNKAWFRIIAGQRLVSGFPTDRFEIFAMGFPTDRFEIFAMVCFDRV